MESFLQESGGLRRSAPVQSPVPIGGRLSLPQRIVLCLFLVLMTFAYLSHLLPVSPGARPLAGTPSGGNR